MTPSATRPAVSAMPSPTAAIQMGGLLCGFGPGSKNGLKERV
ncbi:MAG: hypothetical protein R2717_01150 [Schumannella sp.]